ncbi:5-hydroxytryptamine receptor 3C [Anabarilius grahami]|uniref:5-hydroxytryptamine receptor 3C n=1 Tax=Anabarilius grahami TaxID=495550 RepID=A0A3N0Z8G1_ANAGA|nr:5-hydroxytryptamine receptor 3C [Anabarilius grahami]
MLGHIDTIALNGNKATRSRLRPSSILPRRSGAAFTPPPAVQPQSAHRRGCPFASSSAPAKSAKQPPPPTRQQGAGRGRQVAREQGSGPETGDLGERMSALQEMMPASLLPPEEGWREFVFHIVPPMGLRSSAVPTFSQKELIPNPPGPKRAQLAVCGALPRHSQPSLTSPAGPNKEIELLTISESNLTTFKSKQLFQADGEWELISIDSINSSGNGSLEWVKMDQLIYQIIIKRRPLLYVINIIVPVFFFLVLDVISFFIDTSGENKVSFKVTLLLSISVMLLLVNNILPSTSKQIPLIGIYCCAVFCLITISMVETIFVNFIMAKGAKMRSVETTAAVTGRDDGVRDLEYPPDSVRDQNEEQSNAINLLNLILAEVQAATQRKQRKQRQKLSWTTVARIIDVIFLILYIITIIVLIYELWKLWYH